MLTNTPIINTFSVNKIAIEAKCIKQMKLVNVVSKCIQTLQLERGDGHFLRAMELLMFFSGHHWHQWFFNGFANVEPSPLNVF